MATYNVTHALLVGPNSGYGTDIRCLLDALKRGRGRFKGIAVVPNDVMLEQLLQLKQHGVVGIAYDATIFGPAYYAQSYPLLALLERFDLFLQLQVRGDQLVELMPLIDRSNVKLLIDHCGRPVLADGMHAPGFQTLLRLGHARRAVIKLSGFQKFSQASPDFMDTKPVVDALLEVRRLV
jgi:predicted TIM-barrel fold metal-dependent hydrolase